MGVSSGVVNFPSTTLPRSRPRPRRLLRGVNSTVFDSAAIIARFISPIDGLTFVGACALIPRGCLSSWSLSFRCNPTPPRLPVYSGLLGLRPLPSPQDIHYDHVCQPATTSAGSPPRREESSETRHKGLERRDIRQGGPGLRAFRNGLRDHCDEGLQGRYRSQVPP